MAKKKKNSNYGTYRAPKNQSSKSGAEKESFGYGLPGWLVLLCFVMLIASFFLYSRASGNDRLSVITFFLTGIPAAVFTVGQRNRALESGSKTAKTLTWIFGLIAAIYLFSGFSLLIRGFGA